jgi:hypothetical protein
MRGLTLHSIYTHFTASATSVDPDQTTHPCRLISICMRCSEQPVRILVRNNLVKQKANCADPDRISRMCQLIRIYTVQSCQEDEYMAKIFNKVVVCQPQHCVFIAITEPIYLIAQTEHSKRIKCTDTCHHSKHFLPP